MYKYDHILIEKTEPEMIMRKELNTFMVQRNHHGGSIGEVLLRYEDGKLYGWFKTYSDCKGLYPSIAYQVTVDEKPVIMGIGLCDNRNLDPDIQPL